jgi:hypothetical protein
MAARHPIGRHAELVLRGEHADPFVQAALWRLFHEHPGGLAADIRQRLTHAVTRDDNEKETP